MVHDIYRNLKKDLQVEFRNRSSFNVAFAFAGITTLAVSLVAGGSPLSPLVHALMLWIILFFSAMNGLLHIFTREEEEGTALFLMLNTGAEAVFASKLIFNVVLFLLLEALVTPLYLFFLQVPVASILLLVLTIAAGGMAIACSVTLLAAMVAKAGGKGSLFTVISFPIILPILLVNITTTLAALEKPWPGPVSNVLFLLAFSTGVTVLSFLLFHFIWQDT